MKRLTNSLITALLMFASSAMADNLKVNPVSASPGTTVEIPVELVNTKAYSMFEMNIVLPSGFELTGVTKSERFRNGKLYDFSKLSDGSYQIVTQSQEEVITGNSGTLLTLSVKVPTTAQGSYTGRIQNILFTDMDITPAYLPDASFTITVSKPSTIIITAKSYSREYGEANPTFEYTVTGGTITGNPKLSCTATEASDAGSYTITVEKGTVTGDVQLVNGTLTVTKAPLTVKANDCERFVGEDNPTFTLSYSGWKNSQNESVLTTKPTATCSATKSSPAGTYPIKVSGGSAKNYAFEYRDGTLTVNSTPSEEFYYYVGVQNNWDIQDTSYPFIRQSDGKTWKLTMPCTKEYNDNIADEFKIGTAASVTEGWAYAYGPYISTVFSDYMTRDYGPNFEVPFMEGMYSYTISIVPSTMHYEIVINRNTTSQTSRTVTTSSAGYATFYDSQSAYTLPSGLTASVVSSFSGSKIVYSNLTGNVIPKGTAVMLSASTKKANSYTLTSTTSTATYNGTNLLHGSDEATTTTGDGYHYKLTYGPSTNSSLKDVFGWYWGASNGGSFRVDGHKAWLVLPKSAGARMAGFDVGGETLGISSMEQPQDADGECYDLQGRRVEQPARKGIYINNGKKIVNK
mgnify:CR=1 FL=1